MMIFKREMTQVPIQPIKASQSTKLKKKGQTPREQEMATASRVQELANILDTGGAYRESKDGEDDNKSSP